MTPRDLCFFAMTAVEIWALYPRKTFNDMSLFALEPHIESVLFGESEGIAALVIAGILFVLSNRHPLARGLDVVPLPVFVALGCIPLLVCCGAGAAASWVAVGIAILNGCTKTWLIMLCASMYCQMDTGRAISYTLLSFAVAACVRLPLELAPLWLVCIVAMPMPALCVVACRCGLSRLSTGAKHSPPVTVRSTFPLPAYLVVLAAFGLVLGSFWMVVEPHMGVALTVGMVLLQIVVPLGFLILLLHAYQTISLGFVFQLILVLVMAAALVAGGGEAGRAGVLGDVAPTVAYLSRFFLKMMTITVLIVLAQQSLVSPMALFGVGYGTFLVSLTTGIALHRTVAPWVSTDSFVLVMFLVLVVVMTVVLAISMYQQRDARLFSTYLPGDVPPMATNPLSRRDLVLQRCDELARGAALANREGDVMRLIGLGHSKGYIAEELGLSENTVRGYAKSLYRKLDIHSRHELLELIDEEGANNCVLR